MPFAKEAFLMKPNLIGIGAVLVGAAMLPFSGPILLAGAALEGVYLWNMTRSSRFQRMVRSRRGR
ncbi:MAG: hypothetical protein E6J85_18530 [Deltaproteobacteria bacterium]|nr:MAG: hypothetical protein E6J85_18530 [Deltaproteobacteria bacterium]TMB26528.1 MAG: hypothetical protein E6J61_21775 [Deltaproteobacteria bacterium]